MYSDRNLKKENVCMGSRSCYNASDKSRLHASHRLKNLARTPTCGNITLKQPPHLIWFFRARKRGIPMHWDNYAVIRCHSSLCLFIISSTIWVMPPCCNIGTISAISFFVWDLAVLTKRPSKFLGTRWWHWCIYDLHLHTHDFLIQWFRDGWE